MPVSTRTRNTSEMRKKREVRSAKTRRVRVAALTVDSGRARCGLGVGEEPEAFGALRGRRMEVKVGSAMTSRQRLRSCLRKLRVETVNWERNGDGGSVGMRSFCSTAKH